MTGLQEGNRFNAIANLVRTGQLRPPVSAAEATQILAGTTQAVRAASIGELAPILKGDLTGQEAASILGSASDLTDGNRFNAIAAMGRAKRFGPSIGGDAALALVGASQGSRAAAIGEIAPHLRADMRGQDVAAILGSAQVLTEGNRANAIAALARAGRMPRNTTGAEAEMVLVGATQGARATAISEMALYFRTDMRGQQVVDILGGAQVLSEGNRFNAIAALARAGRMPCALTGAEAEPILAGSTLGNRAAAIAEMAPYFVPELSGESVASILGRSGETTEGNRFSAIAALARAGKLRAGLGELEGSVVLQGISAGFRSAAIGEIANNAASPNSLPPASACASSSTAAGNSSQPALIASAPTARVVTTASIDARIAQLRMRLTTKLPYLYESTGVWSDISIVARDLPGRLPGFTDYRALSDQLYFASIQYAGLASHWIRRGQTAKINGDLGLATRCLDHAALLLQQRRSSYDAAIAAANKDLARATTYVRATYEASKWAAKIVARAAGVPGGSAMVDAAGGFIDFALNAQEGGIENATGQALVDALTVAIIEKMPIPNLGGKTLADALQNQTGKILANSGVIVAVHDGIKDAGVRKAVIDGAKELLAVPIQGRIEDQINAALDRLLAVNPAAF